MVAGWLANGHAERLGGSLARLQATISQASPHLTFLSALCILFITMAIIINIVIIIIAFNEVRRPINWRAGGGGKWIPSSEPFLCKDGERNI